MLVAKEELRSFVGRLKKNILSKRDVHVHVGGRTVPSLLRMHMCVFAYMIIYTYVYVDLVI